MGVGAGVHEAGDAVEEVENTEHASPADDGGDAALMSEDVVDGFRLGRSILMEQLGKGHPSAVVFVAGQVCGSEFAGFDAAREFVAGEGTERVPIVLDEIGHRSIVA